MCYKGLDKIMLSASLKFQLQQKQLTKYLIKLTSPFVKFAQYVSSGKTKSAKLFVGLIDVFVNGEIATEGGKKLMGLHYSPEVESFAINLYT